MKVKKLLNQIMQDTLRPIRERREKYEEMKPEIFEILRQGTEYSVQYTNQMLSEVKKSIGVGYYEDEEFQSKLTSAKVKKYTI